MYTDLFKALLDSRNSRDHPILLAMLYTFCPAAAHWWGAGVDPLPPFDLVWQVLEMRDSGRSLKEALESLGFGGVVANVDAYLKWVEHTRRQKENKGVVAPELAPQYRGGGIAFPDRFGYADAFKALGLADKGRWTDVSEFARIWVYVYVDWALGANIRRVAGETEEKFVLYTLALTAPGVRKPAYFPAWGWQVRTRNVIRNVIGLLVEDVKDQDQLRFALALMSAPADDKYPWPYKPEIYALDRRTGVADPYNPTVDIKDALGMIEPLSRIARRGPFPPMNAIGKPHLCKQCGFWDQCYRKGVLSEFAVRSLEVGIS